MFTKSSINNYLQSTGVTINGSKPYDIHVHDDRFYNRLLFNPSLAAGETYMEGLWDCDRLDELFFRLCSLEFKDELYGKWSVAVKKAANVLFNFQSRIRSKEVAERHYDLGNDLYMDMLGKSMAYTCGYWKNAKTLDQAQYDKFDLVCRKVHLKPGETVLDLGCGWGTLAKFMAENYGCNVIAVNISQEQVRYAQEICKGLPVKVFLCDYRDENKYNPEKKPFDKIVSVGLCEHVGHKNYPRFMQLVRNNLKDNGLFLLHTIGKNESSHLCDPWITKYIFPNGILPSVKLLSGAMENLFIIEDLHNFGADYDKTLMAWHKNFNDNWPHLKEKYSQTFFRLWNYYLLTNAGAFRARSVQLWQMVLSPKGVPGGYETVR